MKNFGRTLFLNLSLGLISVASAFADGVTTTPAGTAAPGVAAKTPGTFEMIIPFLGMFAIMYFLMIRPQQKRAKEQANLISALKTGDEVLTASGILGRVGDISDKIVTVQVDSGVNIRMLKTQIAQVMGPTQKI